MYYIKYIMTSTEKKIYMNETEYKLVPIKMDNTDKVEYRLVPVEDNTNIKLDEEVPNNINDVINDELDNDNNELIEAKVKTTTKAKVKNTAKKAVRTSLPPAYERAMDKLKEVDELIEREELWDILDFDTVAQYSNHRNELIDKHTFKLFKNFVSQFNAINDDINSIDEGKMTKRQVRRPAMKIKSLIKVFDNVKVFLRD